MLTLELSNRQLQYKIRLSKQTNIVQSMNRSSFQNDDSDNTPKYKIIILGKSATGKTKLLTRYQHGFYEDSGVTTISIDFNVMKRPNAIYCYYDTAGQQAFRSIVDHYYKGSDACIIVYDLSSPASFEEIPFYYNKIKQMTEDSLIYIIGCKGDLDRKINDEDVGKKYKGIKHFITSSKTNKGVLEAFSEIQGDLLKLKPKQRKSNHSKLQALDFENGPGKKNGQGKGKKPCCKS